MRRVSFGAYQSVIGVVYLGLMTNVLLLVASLPFVALLLVTDPMTSWPSLALTAPLCAPAVTAAFSTFRAHSLGNPDVVRVFIAAYRASWRGALALGALATAAIVVVLVDVRFFSDSSIGVLVVPLLGLIAVIALAVALLGLTAFAEVPRARLRDVVQASLYLALRRWCLTAISLIVLALFAWFFTTMPAFALGLAASPALYLSWANSRHTLLPVLDATDTVVAEFTS